MTLLSAFKEFVESTPSTRPFTSWEDVARDVLIRSEAWDRWHRGITTDVEALRKQHADDEAYVNDAGKFAWRKREAP